MKTTNKIGIVFYLRRYKRKDGKAPIYVRITIDKKRTDLSMKTEIEIDKWSDAKGMAKGQSEEIRSINTYLEQVRNKIMDCYKELMLKNKLITADLIKDTFLGVEAKENTLLSVFDYHNETMEPILEWGTLKNYFTTRRYIEEFITKKYNRWRFLALYQQEKDKCSGTYSSIAKTIGNH